MRESARVAGEALRAHYRLKKLLGHPIFVVRDGRCVEIAPEEISVD